MLSRVIQGTVSVTGMTCEHCARAVTAELTALADATEVVVDVPTGSVTVTSKSPLSEADIRAAVEEAGYHLAATPATI